MVVGKYNENRGDWEKIKINWEKYTLHTGYFKKLYQSLQVRVPQNILMYCPVHSSVAVASCIINIFFTFETSSTFLDY